MIVRRRVPALLLVLALAPATLAETRAEPAEGTFLVVVNDAKGVNVRDLPRGGKTGALAYGRRVRAKASQHRDWLEVFPPPGPDTCPEGAQCYAKAEFFERTEDVDYDVFFPDLGEGDGALITIGDGDILIDGGRDPNVLRRYLDSRRRPRGAIELVVITAPEPDHWSGLSGVAELPIGELWQPGIRPCDRKADYEALLRAVDRSGYGTRHLQTTAKPFRGGVFLRDVPEVVLTVLFTQSDPPGGGNCQQRADDAALVLMVQIAHTRFLFASDGHGLFEDEVRNGAARYVENRLLKNHRCPDRGPCAALQADVLKVPDHASPTSSSLRFRDAVRPTYAVISAQEHSFGRGHNEVVSLYEEIAQVFRTNAHRTARTDDIRCTNRDGGVSCGYVNAAD